MFWVRGLAVKIQVKSAFKEACFMTKIKKNSLGILEMAIILHRILFEIGVRESSNDQWLPDIDTNHFSAITDWKFAVRRCSLYMPGKLNLCFNQVIQTKWRILLVWHFFDYKRCLRWRFRLTCAQTTSARINLTRGGVYRPRISNFVNNLQYYNLFRLGWKLRTIEHGQHL